MHFDDDDNSLVLAGGNTNDLSLTDFRFPGGTFSGSETSDDEKDFGALNVKYQTWDRRFVKNEERKEKIDQIYKSSVRKLRKTKKNISKLRVKITEDDDSEQEEDEDIDIEDKDKDNDKNEEEGENENDDNHNSKKPKQRKRRRRNKKQKLDELDNSYKQWKKKQNKKGVIYISSVPFGCTSLQLKKIFNEFGMVTNVHLEAAKSNDGKKKKIRNKWTEFCEGWVEFKDKKIAKQVVEILNETKIPKKYVKNRLARNHIWNMKYLKGFGWHHLSEYKQTIRTLQRKKYEIKIADAHRQTAYFESQVRKAKEMTKGLKYDNSNSKEEDDEEEESEDKQEDEEEDDDKREVYGSSSEDDNIEPPTKKQKVVEQRNVRRRRTHGNRQILNKLMK